MLAQIREDHLCFSTELPSFTTLPPRLSVVVADSIRACPERFSAATSFTGLRSIGPTFHAAASASAPGAASAGRIAPARSRAYA